MQQSSPVYYLLQHISALLAKQSDQVLQEQLGIGLAQYRILQTLQLEPRTPQREISLNLGQTEASISRQVRLMLQDGLLQSVRSTQDHREHITVLTPKGERLADAAQTALAKYFSPLVGGLSDKQQEQLAASLEHLHQAVCGIDHPGRSKIAH